MSESTVTSPSVWRPLAEIKPALRAHWLFAALIGSGVLVRAATVLAFPPALFFSDSWAYVSTAFGHHLVSLPYLRPVGYPVLIRLLTLPGRDVSELVVTQHLAGIGVGTLIYVALMRAGVRRVLACSAASLVLLDGYAITLEQYVMPDTFFALTLLTTLLVLAWPRLAGAERSPRTVRAGVTIGLLLAGAALQREVGLFAIPVVLGYLISVRAGRRTFVAVLVTMAVPLVAYAGLMDVKTGVFGLTATSGWTLYGRVAGFADCGGGRVPSPARGLCETTSQRERHPLAPDWYIWAASSPAVRRFRHPGETMQQRARANSILADFARGTIASQPGRFAVAVTGDFLRYFTPGVRPFADAVSATALPASTEAEDVNERIRRSALPATHPVVRSPAPVVRQYRDLVHIPRPVLAALALAAIIALGVRGSHRPEIALFGGTAVLVLLGTSATGGFGQRYLEPVVPLFAIGGSLGLVSIVKSIQARLRRSPMRDTSYS